MVSPSLKAHSSASKLDVTPMFLEKPNTQLPISSLRIPPPPANPGFPKEEPSVFNFHQPLLGLSHLTSFIMNLLTAFQSVAYQWNSLAWLTIWTVRFGLKLVLWKMNLFLCFHNNQIASIKTIFHGGWLCKITWFLAALVVNQVWRSEEKKLPFSTEIPNCSHISLLSVQFFELESCRLFKNNFCLKHLPSIASYYS